MGRVKNVNTTDIADAIRLGCRTMQNVRVQSPFIFRSNPGSPTVPHISFSLDGSSVFISLSKTILWYNVSAGFGCMSVDLPCLLPLLLRYVILGAKIVQKIKLVFKFGWVR